MNILNIIERISYIRQDIFNLLLNSITLHAGPLRIILSYIKIKQFLVMSSSFSRGTYVKFIIPVPVEENDIIYLMIFGR